MAAKEIFNIVIPGIKGKYTVMHVSDLHMVATYEDEDPKAVDATARRVPYFFKSEQESIDRWYSVIEASKEVKPDCMIFTGDIIDFPSKENLDLLEDGLNRLDCPYIYCLGNHDWSFDYNYHTESAKINERPKFEKFTSKGSEYSFLDMGEFVIVAIDNSEDQVTKATYEAVKKSFDIGKPVIIAMHIPICANNYPENTLREDTIAYWKRDICIGNSGIPMQEYTKKFVDLISDESSPVAAILAGHIHFAHKDKINSKVNQYVCCRCTKGEYVLLNITGV